MATAARNRVLRVLVIDDSDDDGRLLELAFQRLESFRLVGHLSDGPSAMAYLKGEGKYADRIRYPFPDVLFLDLKMPRLDGFEILDWLKQQNYPELRVVVMSGSEYGEDVNRALDLGAHFYRTKPLRFDQQVSMLRQLGQRLTEDPRQIPPPRRPVQRERLNSPLVEE